MEPIKLAIVDDHGLFRAALVSFFRSGSGCEVVLQAESGPDFLQQYELLDSRQLPHVVLMDINMPGDNGIKATAQLKQRHSTAKVLMLTMMDAKENILHAVKAGADGYLLKNAKPDELLSAINIVAGGAKFYDTRVTENIFKLLADDKTKEEAIDEVRRTWDILSKKEQEFVEWACTELTYTEIAKEMNVSVTTVEGWRQSVFTKFGVKTRVGLAMIVAKNDFLKK